MSRDCRIFDSISILVSIMTPANPQMKRYGDKLRFFKPKCTNYNLFKNT
ncbi:hypothetical protein HMPREF3213_02950 [Heyndrickxia coagulans]|uniref:Uncharacterized protein n=1 Tax=Heyndrickxia coagulans TaxID=1398 RepID=A0A133KGK9_HEYCO|nr:hypothetical protein HMPREF3213_02950 [Heyndrickxia coagulans]